MFYANNEAADIFFVMKPKTGRMLLYSGNPNHTIFDLGKTLLLFPP